MARRISDITLQQVKQFSGIVDYVQQYVDLKRRGRNYLGLCPFHSEKTPSFTVSPEKQIFHCFGCHESGDLISFAEKIDNLTFYEAIETIAAFAGISVDYDESSNYSSRQNKFLETILKSLRLSSDYFLKSFYEQDKPGKYLLNRGVSTDVIKEFSLGFCDHSDSLLTYLEKHEVDSETLIKSGIFSKTNSGLFSRFHRRLMFPIYDFQNRLIGFGGRTLDSEDKVAKYVNSDETDLFNKRRILYGLNLAKPTIRKQQCVILVEGYMDVIACHQHGFSNTVACMGTSLTQEQVKLLKRLTNTIYLMLDSDQAGIDATLRSIDVLKEFDFSIFVVPLEEKDPADFLKQFGIDALNEKLSSAQPYLGFMFHHIKKKYNLEQIESVSKCVSEIAKILANEPDELIRSHYISVISQDLNIKQEIIIGKINDLMYNNIYISSSTILNKKTIKGKILKSEEILLSLSLVNKDLIVTNKDNIMSLLTTDENKKLLDYVLSSGKSYTDLAEISDSSIQKDLMRILFEYQDFTATNNQLNTLNDCLTLLQDHAIERKRAEIVSKLKVYEKENNEEKVLECLQQLKNIQKRI